MSHLRDIQRLRQTKNLQPISSISRNSNYRPVDIYNINFERPRESQPYINNNNTENLQKYGHSREMINTSRQRKIAHRRGSSNSNVEPTSPALSIYNFSQKSNQKVSNTVGLLREKNLSTNQFESQPIQMNRVPITKVQMLLQPSSIRQYERIYPIGKGGFGKVWKVQAKKTRIIYAMKEMLKAKVIGKKSINSVVNERQLLAKVRHPYLINMSHAFQDRQKLYLIMDYVDGGDLRYHLGKRRRFTQIQSKFFIANLIIGLQYLHRNKIIHRDIKPQNLVLDSQGYLRITDLGISRQLRQQNYQDTSGTPGYMAPQVMCRKNHSFTTDYFAVGIMAYEFMLGKRPYVGRNRKEIRDQILSKQACVRMEEIPNRWSVDAADFINKLLQRNPNSRLGASGIEQIKKHDWLRTVDFSKLQRKEVRAPYMPVSIEENYQDYRQQISEDTIDDNAEQNMLILRDPDVQSLFDGYQYEPSQKKQRKRSICYSTNSTEIEGRRTTR